MSNKYISYAYDIISSFFEKKYPEELEERVQYWLVEKEHEEDKNRALKMYWDALEVEDDKAADRALAKIKAKAGIPVAREKTPLKRLVLIAAAVVLPLVMLAGGYVWMQRQTAGVLPEGEILGEVVRLEKYETGEGERREIKLADGTMVLLEENSTVTAPEKFFDKDRKVVFDGQGRFKVTGDPGRPFIVETPAVTVWVLGTEFDLKAYKEEKIVNVALINGNISVETAAGEMFNMEPGQSLTYDTENAETTIYLRETKKETHREQPLVLDAELTGEPLEFENKSLEEIFMTIERSFGVRFETGAAKLPDERFTLKFIYGENIGQIMETLEILTGAFRYKITGNVIYINAS